jgi:hypothetical protein
MNIEDKIKSIYIILTAQVMLNCAFAIAIANLY